MSEFKGTPAPWKWNGEDYRGDWGWQILVGPEGQGIVIGEAPQGIFKGLKSHQDVEPELCKTGFNAPENGAAAVHVRYHNAKLIAAAPELLKALQGFYDYYNRIYGDDGDYHDEHPIAVAKAAIAKALGETK